jgi:hypothetical protein
MSDQRVLKAIYIHQAVQLGGKLNNFMTIDDGFVLSINQRGNVEAYHKTKNPERITEIAFTNLSCALWEVQHQQAAENVVKIARK